MKILQKIMDGLSKREISKYSVDINLLLRRFLDYEVEIPGEFYESREKKGLIGSAMYYLKSLDNIEFAKVYGFTKIEILESESSEDSYTWAGRISHDFHYMIANTSDSFYVAMQINKGGDPRCRNYESRNNNSYTDVFLLKFKDIQDFHDLTDEEITENATFGIEVDGKTYLVTPQLQNEYLWVRYVENDEYVDIPDICAYNDEELITQIKRYNNDRNGNIQKVLYWTSIYKNYY